ncbi:hypothetical protein ETAA8_34260 [Anatilimnocola aggregata]|uniref:Transposase n=1 Tax=Anatilimnocola aggregata TaxID=2528021 RepID=A0A517YDL1_9BACT|nr:hypothetical protein ETAA8_34260 [Anatilimnocola aggregata]
MRFDAARGRFGRTTKDRLESAADQWLSPWCWPPCQMIAAISCWVEHCFCIVLKRRAPLFADECARQLLAEQASKRADCLSGQRWFVRVEYRPDLQTSAARCWRVRKHVDGISNQFHSIQRTVFPWKFIIDLQYFAYLSGFSLRRLPARIRPNSLFIARLTRRSIRQPQSCLCESTSETSPARPWRFRKNSVGSTAPSWFFSQGK